MIFGIFFNIISLLPIEVNKIIGTNHAGIAAANTLLDNYPGNEIVMIDRNTNLSYLGCGTALWVGRQIDSYEGLFYTCADAFAKKGAKISLETTVDSIDFAKKVVYGTKKSGEKFEETYDKLILATGSLPISPALAGNDLEGINFLKLFQAGQEVDKEYKGNGRVSSIVTEKGEYPADLVINAIGFMPNNALGKDHLELWKNGAYAVDKYQQTSDPDVYAVGDCATIYSNALRDKTYIALASNAVRTGIVAAHNIGGTKLEGIGVQGSNAICVFGRKLASTGLSVAAAEKAGLEVEYTDFEDTQRPGFMRENEDVKIRIVYEKSTRRVVGTQLSSKEDVSMAIHMFSLAIEEGVTIDKLKLLDIFFLPHFNKPYNYITMAALNAK